MTAATKARPGSRRPVSSIDLPIKASTMILAGTIVCTDASGWAVPATATTALRPWGKAQATKDNTSGGNGALKVNVLLPHEIWIDLWTNDTGTALAAADRGKRAYMLDNQTLTKDASGNSPGPYVYEVTSEGVWAWFEAAAGDPNDPTAVEIPITDSAGRITATNVESGLAELAGRVIGAVADATALQAIAAAARVDGMIAVKLDDDTLWTFDAGSSASASAWVLVPAAGTGRWVRKQASVADLAALAVPAMQAVNATLASGTVTINAGITVAANSEVIPLLIGALTGTTNLAQLGELKASRVNGAPGVGTVIIQAYGDDGALDADAAGAIRVLILTPQS